MKFFLKLNAVSFLYVLIVFVLIQLTFNYYRIERITGWDAGTDLLIFLTFILFPIGGGILGYFLMIFWLEGRASSLFTAILWVPYYFLLASLMANLFPITYRGDIPGSGAGLMVIIGLFVYPIYILTVTAFGIALKIEPKKDIFD